MRIAHFLALDTVAVVVFWSLLAGELCGSPLSLPALFLAPAGVWLVYTADRWLDSFPGSRETSPGPRHRFARRNRHAILPLWLLVLLCTTTTGLVLLPSLQLVGGAILILLAIGYLFLVQTQRQPRRKTLDGSAKTLAVALLVGGAACLFPILRGTQPFSGRLLVYALIALVFLPQTITTRFWEDKRPVPIGLPACLLVVAPVSWITVDPTGGFAVAALAVGTGLAGFDLLPVADKVSVADWILAAGGALGWIVVQLS